MVYEGLFQTFYSDGSIREESYYKEGKLNGVSKLYFPNGKLMEENTFRDNVKEGASTLYYENGNIKSQLCYSANKLSGTAKYYFEDGELKAEITYLEGKKNGPAKVFYKSGSVREDKNHVEDKIEGVVSTYYKSGKIKGEWNYTNGVPEGKSKFYYESGELMGEKEYKGSRMTFRHLLYALLLLVFIQPAVLIAQTDQEEPVEYYQMEPYDDSLFINIQMEVFIDPPDPKAEIIVDLRDKNNQTVAIKGMLYPLLAFKPETRARIITYPFKLNLLDNINFASVFTHVLEKIKLTKMLEPPRLSQISSPLQYINPYLQIYGGERFGIPIKDDLGISFGLGTPYSGPRETDFAEANIHILGFYGGAIVPVEAIFSPKNSDNPLYVANAYQVGYVIPFGNFFEFNYMKTYNPISEETIILSQQRTTAKPKFLQGDYYNWELRYPFRTLGASRAKVYLAKYLNEWHAGFTGRELSLAGSTFDLRIDALFDSPERSKQYLIDILVQKIASSWGFSAFAFGPSILMSYDNDGNFGFTSFFINARLKVGTSF